jgi:two-component system, LytTR family, response regulator
MSLSVLIVDDEPAARRGLRRLLEAEPDIVVAGECADGMEAIAAIGELTPDVVLLDIQMPELSGFDVVDAVGLTNAPMIIFVTAFDQHAVRAFDVHAVDYVLKPVDGERLRRALDRARLRKAVPAADALLAALRELGKPDLPRYARRLAIKGVDHVALIDVREIDRLESDRNYVEVHVRGAVHLLRETLTSLEGRLDPARFVRVSRSAILAVDRIRELRPTFNGDCIVVLRDGTEVPGSRRYRQALERLGS